MAEAFVYDHIRTPRGRGKAVGSLHEVKPITLLTGVLKELQKRHDLDTSQVDDVVMGCVTPVGEQGSCIAKTAALYGIDAADLARASLVGQQIHLLSPLVASTYLLVGQTGVEFGELQRFVWKWALASCGVFMAAALLVGAFPFAA